MESEAQKIFNEARSAGLGALEALEQFGSVLMEKLGVEKKNLHEIIETKYPHLLQELNGNNPEASVIARGETPQQSGLSATPEVSGELDRGASLATTNSQAKGAQMTEVQKLAAAGRERMQERQSQAEKSESTVKSPPPIPEKPEKFRAASLQEPQEHDKPIRPQARKPAEGLGRHASRAKTGLQPRNPVEALRKSNSRTGAFTAVTPGANGVGSPPPSPDNSSGRGENKKIPGRT